MSDDEVKGILSVQPSGVEPPARSATVFFLAASAAAMDVEVGIYFTQTGPTLLQRGTPDKRPPQAGRGPPPAPAAKAGGPPPLALQGPGPGSRVPLLRVPAEPRPQRPQDGGPH